MVYDLKYQKLGRNAYIYKEGEPVENIFFIKSGIA